MSFLARVSLLGVLIGSVGCAGLHPMDQRSLEALIAASADEFRGQPGFVQFRIDGVELACMSDVAHDRMRIVAPIGMGDAISPDLLGAMLVANYHTTLDARYAVSEGIVYATYLHPLASLTEAQVASALRQVVSLVQTFGTSFWSGELSFGPQDEQDI